jgi:hypothetical protein
VIRFAAAAEAAGDGEQYEHEVEGHAALETAPEFCTRDARIARRECSQ